MVVPDFGSGALRKHVSLHEYSAILPDDRDIWKTDYNKNNSNSIPDPIDPVVADEMVSMFLKEPVELQ